MKLGHRVISLWLLGFQDFSENLQILKFVRKLQIFNYLQWSQGFWNSTFSLTKYFVCWAACKHSFNPKLITLRSYFIFVSNLDLTLPSFFIVDYYLREKNFVPMPSENHTWCSVFVLVMFFLAIIVIFFTSLSFHMQGLWCLVSFLYSVQNSSVQHNWTVKV